MSRKRNDRKRARQVGALNRRLDNLAQYKQGDSTNMRNYSFSAGVQACHDDINNLLRKGVREDENV